MASSVGKHIANDAGQSHEHSYLIEFIRNPFFASLEHFQSENALKFSSINSSYYNISPVALQMTKIPLTMCKPVIDTGFLAKYFCFTSQQTGLLLQEKAVSLQCDISSAAKHEMFRALAQGASLARRRSRRK